MGKKPKRRADDKTSQQDLGNGLAGDTSTPAVGSRQEVPKSVEKQVEEVPELPEAEDKEALLERLDKDEAAIKEQLSRFADEVAEAKNAEKEVEEKSPDPALAPPEPSRPDWAEYVKKLSVIAQGSSADDEEKIKQLQEALTQRIEDTKNVEEHKVLALQSLSDAQKEKERCKQDTQRAKLQAERLEASCRELQTQKMTIAKENQSIAEEERGRHSELKAKFEQAIKDVQEKMDAELEVRQHFLKENDDLRGKLLKFTETYEAQEKQLAEQREAREREMEAAQQRLVEHEAAHVESKANANRLIKENESLRKSQAVLRDELQTILAKFDEFHEAVTGSNTRHSECKSEIDDLQTKLQEYEKENIDLKSAKDLTQATEDSKVAEKQRDALEKLCDNLAKENKKLQEQVDSLKKGKS